VRSYRTVSFLTEFLIRQTYFLLHLSSFEFQIKRPVVIRLAALWCSDFPLTILFDKRLPDLFRLLGKGILAKNVQQLQLEFIKKSKLRNYKV